MSVLTCPFTGEEVAKALFQMHPSKASGPDGMSANFFKKFWHVVAQDVIATCLVVLNDGMSPVDLNHTHIALIPKINNPRSPANFRPISLCNVAFKIIIKTNANRLKRVLPSIIDPTQSAFVPGRLIRVN